MQTSAYLRMIIAGLLLAGLGSASACGSTEEDDEPNGGAGTVGSGGSGGMDASTAGPVECGTEMCAPFIIPITGAPPVEACCAEGEVCGLDSSVLEAFGPTFEERCQARDQPGERDPSCPNSTSTTLDGGFNIEFDGCCRTDSGTCGYMLDTVLGVYELGLGCVDSEPFLEGGTPPPCGEASTGGAGGAPGTGGEGGAIPASGGGGAAGDNSSAAGGA
jgi:hypothetical protein